MVYEECVLIMPGFLVNPKLLFRYVRIPVVLAEIRELLINVPADICAIDYPNLVVAACFALKSSQFFN